MRSFVLAVCALALAGCVTTDPVPLGAGDWVVARWTQEDPYWYPAIVSSRTGDELSLRYDDGDIGVQPALNVRRFDWRHGTRLECRFEGGAFQPAAIARMAPDRYRINVRYDDGATEDTDTSKCREP
ncbi:MAG: hypothetical protein ACREH4_12510 [Vitreimonas sp.]